MSSGCLMLRRPLEQYFAGSGDMDVDTIDEVVLYYYLS